jgi:NTE family protein
MANGTGRNGSRPPFECVALILQGGGALGSYQAGAYQALAEADLHPDWVAGISIGAINAAIIAGNAPEHRVDRLRQFWEEITAGNGLNMMAPLVENFLSRTMFNRLSASSALMQGAPGFFRPRFPGPALCREGSIEATSFYDTSLLQGTLERVVDFDRLNSGQTRLSAGAVNVKSGNFVYFDTTTHKIAPEHIMASGALPPGFPAVEIDGEFYWDGGLLSNTPLQWVVQLSGERMDTLAFEVDLWSARGEFPRNLGEVAERHKEIQFSSRTRANVNASKKMQKLRIAAAKLIDKLPPELRATPEAELLAAAANHKVYNIVHLIYRSQPHDLQSKDYEFSRYTMEESWTAGYEDTARMLGHPEVLERPTNLEGFQTFDFAPARA